MIVYLRKKHVVNIGTETILANTMFVSAKMNPSPKQNPKEQKNLDAFKKRAKILRERFEEPRKAVFEKEVTFAKEFVKEIIPVEFAIDKEATGLKRIIPIKVTVLSEFDQFTPHEYNYEYESDSAQANPAVLSDE